MWYHGVCIYHDACTDCTTILAENIKPFLCQWFPYLKCKSQDEGQLRESVTVSTGASLFTYLIVSYLRPYLAATCEPSFLCQGTVVAFSVVRGACSALTVHMYLTAVHSTPHHHG